MAAHDVDFLFQVTAPHFVAGVTVNPVLDEVVRAAPIVKYMVGWKYDKVVDYCKSKRWEIK